VVLKKSGAVAKKAAKSTKASVKKVTQQKAKKASKK